jgi:Transmembrane protein 33/Nucleoporin POM33
MSQAQKLEQF